MKAKYYIHADGNILFVACEKCGEHIKLGKTLILPSIHDNILTRTLLTHHHGKRISNKFDLLGIKGRSMTRCLRCGSTWDVSANDQKRIDELESWWNQARDCVSNYDKTVARAEKAEKAVANLSSLLDARNARIMELEKNYPLPRD